MKRALIALVLLAALPVLAADDEEPKDDEVSGEIVFGPQYYADTDNRDSKKFEEYRDVPNGFVIEMFDFAWRPTARDYLTVFARDAVQRDQKILVDFGRQDLWQGSIFWSENPREWTDQATQLFAESSPRNFTLEDSFQSAVRAAPNSVDADADQEWDPGTKGFIIKNGIAQGGHSVEVAHHREVGGAAFEYTPGTSWIFNVSGSQDRRRGTAPQSLGMYFSQSPAEVAAPLDYRTNAFVGSAEYVRKNWNAGVRVGHTTFANGNKSLRWDDQLFLVDEPVNANQANPGRMQISQAVDWGSDQVWLFGGVNLRGRTRIDATVSQGRTTQDDAFLPMTINTLLTAAPLPATNYDGEHRTTVVSLVASSRPLRNVNWSAWYRSYELDNESPSLVFADYVAADYQFPLCGNINVCDTNGDGIANDRLARRSLPYGYKRQALGAQAGWAPVDWFHGQVGFERVGFDREFSAVTSSDEDILKLVLDFDVAEWLTVRTTFRHQDRSADHYDAEYFLESFPTGEANEAAVNEGMRRFSWTDRERKYAALQLDAQPTQKVSVYAEVVYADNRYTDPNTGLEVGQSHDVQEDRNFDGIPETYNILLAGRTRDRTTSYSVGFGYAPTERIHVYGDYTWDTWKYGLETRYRQPVGGIGTDDPLDNWGSDVEDEYDTLMLGITVGLSDDRRWWIDGDASYSRGTGNIDTHFVPGGNPSGDTTLTQFPELDTKLTIVNAAVNHRIRPNLSYALRYWYESWNEKNFASDFNQPYMGDPDNDPGSAQAIYLGLDFKNYTNHILTFMLDFTF